MAEAPVLLPQFGDVPRRPEPVTPRELFCALHVEPEEHVHFLLPAFEFVRAALYRSEPPPCASDGARGLIDALVSWARAGLEPVPAPRATSWPARVVREFAPVGLADGAWLRGFALNNQIETELGMLALKQLLIRFGDPGSGEAYATRYATLLKSLGVPPDSITRWEFSEAQPCADVSYEHGLLGLALGLFPTTFGLEALGFNLWMTAIGPCPLLEGLSEPLRARSASLRYLARHERARLNELAERAIEQALREALPEAELRVARGFAAAQRSYARWAEGMLGRNVPFTPRQFVLEGIKRKARFAAEHHRDIKLARCSVQELLLGDERAHEQLLERMARSALIKRGCPAESKFMTRSLSIEGPMFDAFTPAEKVDLAEWITSLGEEAQGNGREGNGREGTPEPAREPPVALAGEYTAPQDPAALELYAQARFGEATNNELYYYCVNSDLYPAITLFARGLVDGVLEVLSDALDDDPRLNGAAPPYSERAVAELVARQHDKNVTNRKPQSPLDAPDYAAAENIGAIFDGCWLVGFLDFRRAEFEEYGWLFRIYASEHGDGELAYNHSRIFRHEFAALGPDVMLPKTDRRLYDCFEVAIGSVATLAIGLNTRRFMPEILGLNLGIEASGVGGEYLERYKRAEQQGLSWEALAARLHNSIDNYADGHTKWSLAAVQAFMRRVKDGAPALIDEQWRRIWRLWRLQDILTHGSEAEQAALAEHINLTSLAPTG